MRILIALAVLAGPAWADSPACIRQHQSCEAWRQKALGTSEENPEDHRQWKLACDAAEKCERDERDRQDRIEAYKRQQREAEQRAEQDKRDAAQRAQEIVRAEEERQRAAAQAAAAAQAKAARRPAALSAAVCAYLDRAKHARASTVTYRSGNVFTTSKVSRAAAARAGNRLAAKVRKAAADEGVRLRACGDKDVKQLVRCLTADTGDCDADVVEDATAAMNDAAMSDE